MNVKIGKKDWNLEYTFEAALYEDCVEKIMILLGTMSVAEDSKGLPTREEIAEATKSIASMPKTVITLFYAGLLENNPVETEEDAKKLLKQYFNENPEAENANFYGMFGTIVEQMGEDGFFKQIGMGAETNVEDTVKIPQDHKPKTRTTRATEK